MASHFELLRNRTAYAPTTAKQIAGTTKDARSDACVSLRLVSHSPANIGTSFVHTEFASPMMAVFAVCAILCCAGVIYLPTKVIFTVGQLPFSANVICLVAMSGFMSLMFPTIYGIALGGLDQRALKLGASGLIMAILFMLHFLVKFLLRNLAMSELITQGQDVLSVHTFLFLHAVAVLIVGAIFVSGLMVSSFRNRSHGHAGNAEAHYASQSQCGDFLMIYLKHCIDSLTRWIYYHTILTIHCFQILFIRNGLNFH